VEKFFGADEGMRLPHFEPVAEIVGHVVSAEKAAWPWDRGAPTPTLPVAAAVVFAGHAGAYEKRRAANQRLRKPEGRHGRGDPPKIKSGNGDTFRCFPLRTKYSVTEFAGTVI